MKTMIQNILLALFGRQKTTERANFFDYPAREKKKVIVAAARGAAKMQEDTIRKYQLSISQK